jgi:hypothetical protein
VAEDNYLLEAYELFSEEALCLVAVLGFLPSCYYLTALRSFIASLL